MKTNFLILSLCLLLSCGRKTNLEPQANAAKDVASSTLSGQDQDCSSYDSEYYVQQFIESETFATVLRMHANRGTEVVEAVVEAGGEEALREYETLVPSYTDYSQLDEFYTSRGIDAELMLDKKADVMTSFTMLLLEYPCFRELSDDERREIMEQVFEKLYDPEYREQHAEYASVVAVNELMAHFSPNGREVTREEFMDCLKDAVIGAAVGAIFAAYNTFTAAIDGNLGWGQVKDAAKKSLRFFGSVAAGAVIGFGLCIAWEYFF